MSDQDQGYRIQQQIGRGCQFPTMLGHLLWAQIKDHPCQYHYLFHFSNSRLCTSILKYENSQLARHQSE